MSLRERLSAPEEERPLAVVVPEAASRAYQELKKSMHQMILDRIDLERLKRLTPEQFKHELALLIQHIIEEERIVLNQHERHNLVLDIQHEMLGFGPLEPLLADPTISDILVNTCSRVYVERRGKPYSWTFNNDLKGDNVSGNDLMYIPSAPGSGQVKFAGDTATNNANETKFWNIVNNNKALKQAAGGVVGRNTDFSPWTNSFDVRVAQEIPSFFSGHKAVFTLDIFNVGNLLNKKWGRINEVGFNSGGGAQARSFVDYVGMENGKYVYQVRDKVEDLDVRQSKGESQWAIQATVKYEF